MLPDKVGFFRCLEWELCGGGEFFTVVGARGEARTSQQMRTSLYLKAIRLVFQGNLTLWNHMDHEVYHMVAVAKFIPTNKLNKRFTEGNARPCIKVEK